MAITLAIGLSGLFLAAAPMAGASARNDNNAQLCDHAARSAAQNRGVPYDVLKAISRVETGRNGANGLEPWPWTVNMEGTGKWFETEDAARAYVFKHFKRGARSFDVGCFQVNYKWHGAAFRSIDEMFDPMINANYAAGFLRELYQEFGDWSAAAGAYHSRTPAYARSYAVRFDKVRGTLSPDRDIAALPDVRTGRERGAGLLGSAARAPLFGRGATQMGSLVPVAPRNSAGGPAFVVLN
ncbi:transglycosylase SLT domain-containing protein [Sedimentitalea sp. HM32M-2]|uniref:transglycosylase SLT domain-containing protein n=1 Tax=Sedimentitalea sp. HM32M-2 TaxID=3351566 RepID=UPI00362D71C9